MKNLDITAIILGIMGIVNIDTILGMSYWEIFDLGLKVCVLVVPVLILYVIFVALMNMVKSKNAKAKTRKKTGSTKKAKRGTKRRKKEV
jgi:phosphotransferase system  glucose/maltose/N-acetylglucosamine-specific IIC component